MLTEYKVVRHPEANRRSQVFKWAVFKNGGLFEGFVTREAAEDAVVAYKAEDAVHYRSGE